MRYHWILLIAASSSSCAGNQVLTSGRPLAAYASDKGWVKISDQQVKFQAGRFLLEMKACSTEVDICYSSGNESISVPKKCPSSIVAYYNGDKRFEVVGYVHGIVTVKPRESDSIMFSYSKSMGITAIYWDFDSSGALKDRGGGLGIDRVVAQKYAFRPMRSQAGLPCEGS